MPQIVHQVVVLALPGVVPFELAIPARLFGAALGPTGAGLYAVRTCTLDGAPVRTSADFAITVEHDASVLAGADTVVIPPSHDPLAWAEDTPLRAGVAAALDRARPGTRLLSICTGSFVLAATGRLDGRTVTTHWRESASLQRLFPRVTVDPDVLFVDDGDVLTSAGVTAGIDLCLHVIRRDHGSEVANAAARACVTPPWRDGGQAQYIPRPVPDPAASAATWRARGWALEQLHRPVTLAELAGQAGMSVRTFTRRFRQETGLSPGRWLTGQRVERARQLLEATDLSVDAVAERSGLGTGASLRAHLLVAAGVSPQAYRRTFRTAR